MAVKPLAEFKGPGGLVAKIWNCKTSRVMGGHRTWRFYYTIESDTEEIFESQAWKRQSTAERNAQQHLSNLARPEDTDNE